MITSGANRRVVLRLLSIVLLMGGASFAAVPLYDLFCRVTGYGGTTSVAVSGSEQVLERTIRIRFDSNVAPGLPWQFQPMAREVTLKIGETGIAFYEARNLSDIRLAGTAGYNVVPYSAGAYFNKIACFCFTEQVLKPGETVQMPVSFFVDPDILNDPEAREVREITLSYTFHPDALPEEASALQPQPSQVSTGLN